MRPILLLDLVLKTVKPYGEVLNNEILWSIILLQVFGILKRVLLLKSSTNYGKILL